MKATTGGKDETFTGSKPNPVLVSRQIEGLREVIQRLRASKTMTLDSLTSEKLEQLKNHYPAYS